MFYSEGFGYCSNFKRQMNHIFRTWIYIKRPIHYTDKDLKNETHVPTEQN